MSILVYRYISIVVVVRASRAPARERRRRSLSGGGASSARANTHVPILVAACSRISGPFSCITSHLCGGQQTGCPTPRLLTIQTVPTLLAVANPPSQTRLVSAAAAQKTDRRTNCWPPVAPAPNSPRGSAALQLLPLLLPAQGRDEPQIQGRPALGAAEVFVIAAAGAC